jgi:deoxyribonuclease V
MHTSLDHDWNLSWDEARRVQQALADQVTCADDFGTIRTVAGVDLAYPRTATGVVTGRAAVVVLAFPGLEVVEEHVITRPVTFPYIPGLLSFREAPIALAALQQLRAQPDVLLVDGHGIAHPRRFGIASHLGVLLDLPTIGCAKSILVGRAGELGALPGETTPLLDGDEVIGTVLRTRARSRPLYVSPGHRISVETAASLVMRCTRGYRLPEPTRLADRLAGQHGRAIPAAE